MIRFKDQVFEDYFIDPVTAVITDINGKVKNQWLGNSGYMYVSIHGIKMAVHRIMIYTYRGYKPNMDVHHKDENKLNNALSNLKYLTRSKHVKITKTGKKRPDLSIRNTETPTALGKSWWSKEGEKPRLQRECPGDGWILGRDFKPWNKRNELYAK